VEQKNGSGRPLQSGVVVVVMLVLVLVVIEVTVVNVVPVLVVIVCDVVVVAVAVVVLEVQEEHSIGHMTSILAPYKLEVHSDLSSSSQSGGSYMPLQEV
jgi:hypothetical protein